jgi:hypothetical protein
MGRIAGCVLGLGLAIVLTACGDDGGTFCCQCVCCAQTATLKRQDQTWPDCGKPCDDFCAQQLACHQMVESANPCP